MAKSLLRIEARRMRGRGESVKEIARLIGVSKSTASLWVRDIILSVEQLENLKQRSIRGSELGRLKGALAQKQRRLQTIEKLRNEGRAKVGTLSGRELLLSGVALYWAEGSKKTRSVEFCNSDPVMINFMIKWLESVFGVTKDRLALTIGINEIHRERGETVKKHWSQVTGVAIEQFRKTSFKKAVSRKIYENHDTHFGTLKVKVLRPGEFYYRIMGLIDALGMAA